MISICKCSLAKSISPIFLLRDAVIRAVKSQSFSRFLSLVRAQTALTLQKACYMLSAVQVLVAPLRVFELQLLENSSRTIELKIRKLNKVHQLAPPTQLELPVQMSQLTEIRFYILTLDIIYLLDNTYFKSRID